METAEALAAHGLPGAADSAMLSDTGLVPRILSIQPNRGVGYAVDTGFQVLNAIMQSGADNKRWDTLDKVAASDENVLRPATCDAVLSTLFPDMSRGIATGYGRLDIEPQCGGANL